MERPDELSHRLFHPRGIGFFLGILSFLGVYHVSAGNGVFFRIPSLAAAYLGLTAVLAGVGASAWPLVRRFLAWRNLFLPTVVMWAYPMATLFLGGIVGVVLLRLIPALAGRGFWSHLLGVNAKATTVFFTTTYSGFFFWLMCLTLGASVQYVRWSLDSATHLHETMEPALRAVADAAGAGSRGERLAAADGELRRLKTELGTLEQTRETSRRFNRHAVLLLFIGLGILSAWIIYFRPALIVYYRAEIQIRSMQQPEVALENLRHLQRRFPDYPYLDTVAFRAAWVLDRRLERWGEAVAAYEEFLRDHGLENVWADDAVANLVRLALDKTQDPGTALRWIRLYLERFPTGPVAPQVTLYEARALMAQGQIAAARAVLTAADERFRGRQLPLYDSEDDLIGLISFADARRAIALPRQEP
jgi:tetratricopeptide (TPR) repeat protein